MRFLEFVPCGRRATARPDHSPPQRTPAEAPAAVPATNPLSGITAPGSEATPSPGKRRRRGSGATPHWRPSLGAISEDGVLLLEAAFAEGKKARARAATQAGRPKATPQARTRGLDYRDDYRASGEQAVDLASPQHPHLSPSPKGAPWRGAKTRN